MEKTWRYHHAQQAEYEEVFHYKGRGRPKEGEQPKRITWKIVGSLGEREEVIEQEKHSLGKFVLSTSLEQEALCAQDALSNYKAQGSSVERGFRFLKEPMFFANAVYLKKPSRIMALLMVMTLSLLGYSLAEKELREKLKEKELTVPDQKGKPTQKITMRRVFQMFLAVTDFV